MHTAPQCLCAELIFDAIVNHTRKMPEQISLRRRFRAKQLERTVSYAPDVVVSRLYLLHFARHQKRTA